MWEGNHSTVVYSPRASVHCGWYLKILLPQTMSKGSRRHEKLPNTDERGDTKGAIATIHQSDQL